MKEVKVALACGREMKLKMNEGGTMLVDQAGVQPIVPLGRLI